MSNTPTADVLKHFGCCLLLVYRGRCKLTLHTPFYSRVSFHSRVPFLNVKPYFFKVITNKSPQTTLKVTEMKVQGRFKKIKNKKMLKFTFIFLSKISYFNTIKNLCMNLCIVVYNFHVEEKCPSIIIMSF